MNAEPPRLKTPQTGVMEEPQMDWLPQAGHPPGRITAGSRFVGKSGVAEWHITLATDGHDEDPAKTLEDSWLNALDAAGLTPESTVMRHVYCSDVANQAASLECFGRNYPGAFSIMGQPPLPGRKLAIWSTHITDPAGPLDRRSSDGWHGIQRGTQQHCWTTGLIAPGDANAGAQCQAVLDRYTTWLADHDMTLSQNVLRTWWHMRDIDHEYGELVEVRREFFQRYDLTELTHYIASTGIAGAPAEPTARLSFDAYAIQGLTAGQVEHLNAPAHLGPTHEYGVTFERASKVSFADRSLVYLSGTASIDVAGEIVHPGDVSRQFERAMENSGALLAAAGAGFGDLAMILVYLRDPADGALIEQICQTRFPGLPMLILHAPVCRPGWLVEVEGVAVISASHDGLPEF